MVFVRTKRVQLLKCGGGNPITNELRKELQAYLDENLTVHTLARGFVTAGAPLQF